MKAKNVCWVAMAIALAACSGKNELGKLAGKNELGKLPVVAHSVDFDGK